MLALGRSACKSLSKGTKRRSPRGPATPSSLLRAGVPFPFSCQFGNCGTCKCQLLIGNVTQLAHSEHLLAPAERARGVVLACRTQLWSDASIRRID
jgi:CDP-4-dehydro-6-deoxyglucose reductase/ferredoxin-NAD(P)+ reductase (naphthalene dioxygenase ferredoxin-specific)